MSSPLVGLLIGLSVGILLGGITLPWSDKPGVASEKPLAWLLLWACFWPLLGPHLLWQGLLEYQKAWRGYSNRRQMRRHRALRRQSDQDHQDFADSR